MCFSLPLISANVTEYPKLEHDASQLPSPLTVQSPIEAFFTNSPLKSFVASPQLRSKQNQVTDISDFYHYVFFCVQWGIAKVKDLQEIEALSGSHTSII